MWGIKSRPCKGTGDAAEVCDEGPGDCTDNGCLEVFGQSSTPAEPLESSLDDPALGVDLEALRDIGTLDDLDCQRAMTAHSVAQLGAGIAAVRKDMPPPGIKHSDRAQRTDHSVAILNFGGVNIQADEIAGGMNEEIRLTC